MKEAVSQFICSIDAFNKAETHETASGKKHHFWALLKNMSYCVGGPRKFRSWQIAEETAQAILKNANIHSKICLLPISFSEASGS